MNTFINSIADFLSLPYGIVLKLISSIVVLCFLFIIRFTILRIVWKNTTDIDVRYQWRRTLSFLTPFISTLIIIIIWISAIDQFGAFLGLITAGLAIAFKDPLTNLAGWLFIVFRKPFVVGDRVQIGKNTGDIIDIRLFQFTILEIGNWVDADQSTGRIIHLPNGKVFQEAQANYSSGFRYIWNEIPVTITFESDWIKAKETLNKIINNHAENITNQVKQEIIEASKQYKIHYTYLTPIVYTSVREHGVRLTIRYLCSPQARRNSENDIWQEILVAFRAQEIYFAYPTTRFYNGPEQRISATQTDQ